MSEWKMRPADLKQYPHFDRYLPPTEIDAIIKSPERVARNKFYPFLRYEKKWQPFRTPKDETGADADKPEKKKREIRYASRRDAYIFSYYRHKLSIPYEAELKRLGLHDCVIAYRRILSPGGGGGKCNIHFAKDAFDVVTDLGTCCAVALDISKYFEHIDHVRLRSLWCRMLGVSDLPQDHETVYRNITKYRYVDREKVYERLGYFGIKKHVGGRPVRGYLRAFKKMPMQLCCPIEFREKIVGGSSEYPSLINKNDFDYGIPQGAPISDLLANLYLLDFDTEMNAYVNARGGAYFRYSDDILIIVPGGAEEGEAARALAVDRIQNFGPKLEIKDRKTCIVCYTQDESGGLTHHPVPGRHGKNGLEYLGFRFDGKRVFLRDSTVSGFHRRIAAAARQACSMHVARYQGKDLSYLRAHFDLEGFISRFGRIEGFDDNDEYRDWTFWTYALRAVEVFKKLGLPIIGQIQKYREVIQARIDAELVRAFSKRTTV